MIRLPCRRHGQHDVDAIDTARIVAALTGALYDQEADPIKSMGPQLYCPVEVLDWSNDCEMYLEHTDSLLIGAGLLDEDGGASDE